MKEKIIKKLYGGKVSLEFYSDGHSYFVDGERKESVTGIIGVLDKSRALIPWAVGEFAKLLRANIGKPISEEIILAGAEQHKIKKQEAADVGSLAHSWIEQFIAYQKLPEMPDNKAVQIAINAFLDWVNENKVKFISTERVVYSKKYDFVGKLDVEAKVNGKLCLIDFKTSNGIYNSYFLQTAAYVKADEEESKKKYDGRWLIRLAKETEAEYLKRIAAKGKIPVAPYVPFEAKFLDNTGKELKRDFAGFLACLELYRWNKTTDPFLNKS